MKRFITLLLITVFVQQWAMAAAAPTVPASNLVFKDIDGNRFNGTFAKGNGVNRIVVMKEGSPVVGLPADGVDYAYNTIFGTAGTAFTGAGEFVVGKTSWSDLSVTNLKPGTTYYVAIFEYNGTGAATQYLALPLTGSQATVVAPTTQVTAFSATTATGNTLTLTWAKGNGAGRIVVARKAGAVNADPADLTNYFNSDVFGSGTKIGADNYVVYKGAGTTVTVKGLEPNTTYYFAAFEYNGISFPLFLTPGIPASGTTAAGPSTAPSGIAYTYVEGNSYRISVSVGNGTRRLFVAKKGSPVTAKPQNGITYTVNGAFGAPGTEIAPGEFLVGSTASNYIDMTNLEPNTTYYVRVFEYDVDAAGNTYYLTSTYAEKSGITATTPSTVCSNLRLTALSGSSATMTFTNGNGTYRIVIVKAGSPVDGIPANLSRYTGNVNFGAGDQVAPGNYVIQGGMNGSTVIINSLQAGTTYHVSIYEFNGNYNPVYSATGATMSFTVPVEPANPSTAPSVLWNEGKTFRFNWTNGGGSHRLVVARKGAAVSAKPTDGVTYTASNKFGLGQELQPGEFVVGNGTANFVDMDNLEIGTTYHFAVFDYNIAADGKPDYLTTSYLIYNGSTVGWPTTQSTITGVTGIQATTATINITKGNGAYRLIVMKKGAPVNAAPQDLVKYSYSATFGTASSLLSDGNYVVNMPSGSGTVAVYNLEANTTYYISSFEFNGYESPAYLRTAPATASFTTTDVPGATVPTAPATNGLSEAVDGNKLTLKWTAGNGEKRLVVMRQGAPVNFVPAAGTSYTGNTAFGTGTDLGGGQYVIQNSAWNSVDITNLQPATTYHYTVFEYNGTGTLIRYLTSSVLAGTVATVDAPATPATSPTVTPGATTLTLNWVKGAGSGRLVVVKEGSGVTATPANLSVYPASPTFKSGSQVAAGEYVVFAGSGNTVTITGLQANKTYHYSIFEYNGTAAPVYSTVALTGSATLSATLPISLLFFKAAAANGDVLLTWATAQEVNNATFTIEKSTDGVSYSSVASMPGAGNSNARIDYSYTDVRGAQRNTWYRLKQTDLDGRFTYSTSVLVKATAAGNGIALYPNPVQNQLHIDWPPAVSQATLVVYNAGGVVVKQEKLAAGRPLSCGDLKPGTYYLTLLAGDQQYRATFIKQ